ncbi:MAG: phosphodiester glycosidase family protein [Oscillospiraceae bacterium]|nr:phosphodiester glycosidase family protein [Oscillospiraceae bacterium]
MIKIRRKGEREAPRPGDEKALKIIVYAVRAVIFIGCLVLSLQTIYQIGRTVHPDSETVAVSSAKKETNVSVKIGNQVNNMKAYALDGIKYIKKQYSIPEGVEKAPEPSFTGWLRTTDLNEVMKIVGDAYELLDGQEVKFNTDIVLQPGTEVTCYYDETILAITWKEVRNGSSVTFSEVKIADASQLRRCIAGGTYSSGIQLKASDMAKSVNAVVACNGDFYEFRNLGVTVYDRQLYRCETKYVDTCFFNSKGEMLFRYAGDEGDEEELKAFIEENDILFSVAFGPVVIDNGVKRTIGLYPIGEVDRIYARCCFGKLDELHYLLMIATAEAPYSNAATVNQAADYMESMGCIQAYILDGGQTAVIYTGGKVINRVVYDSERTMSDIIYFATALPSGEVSQ